MQQELEEEPTYEQIALRSQMSVDKVKELLDLIPQVCSLDAPAGEDATLQQMLENILMTLKNNASVFDRSTVDQLKMVVGSMKYSKAFGVSKNAGVVSLEIEICDLIDAIQTELASNTEDTAKNVKQNIMILKQKNALRDTMLKE